MEIKFGTDGWRDLMYDRFNLPNVKRVVQAIAEYVHDHHGAERGIVIGYDARFFSDFFAREAAGVLAANGIKVFLGKRDYPTPVIAYAVTLYKAFGAVMFTASHNPPEYNGIKFIPEYAGPASPEITKAIEEKLKGIVTAATVPAGVAFNELERSGKFQWFDPTEQYLSQIRQLVKVDEISKSKLNIIIDPMYATGRGYLTALLASCPVNEIHGKRDPLFGGFMPDPQAKFLGEAMSLVKAQPNSIGLATDGDADRFGIIDSDGTYIPPNQVIPLLMMHLIKNRGFKGVVARTVATSHMIDRLAELYGIEAIETPVGFKYIGELMRTKPVIIGGEESGGLSIQGHLPEKDGILACALMAELRAVSGKPFLEILKELSREVGEFYSRRVDIHLADAAKAKILNTCAKNSPERIGNLKIKETTSIDGFKFILENGSWFLIRPSGTESLIRVYFETNSHAELEQLITAVEQLVDQWGRTA